MTKPYQIGATVKALVAPSALAFDAGLRIDHFLLSPALADRLVDAQVNAHVRGWEKTSDHAPVWIELSDEPKRKRRQPRSANQSA